MMVVTIAVWLVVSGGKRVVITNGTNRPVGNAKFLKYDAESSEYQQVRYEGSEKPDIGSVWETWWSGFLVVNREQLQMLLLKTGVW